MKSFVWMFFLVGGTGTSIVGDGDSSGLVFFLIFFLDFGGLCLRILLLDSILVLHGSVMKYTWKYIENST